MFCSLAQEKHSKTTIWGSRERMKMHWSSVWIALFLLFPTVVYGGKVLVYPMEGSHWVNMKVIIEELHSRGHQVSVVRSSHSRCIKETSPFYTSITLNVDSGFSEEFITSFVMELLKIQREVKSAWTRFKVDMEQSQKALEMNKKTCRMIEMLFQNKDLMQSLHDTKYDLVLADPVMPAGAILANYLKLPLVFNVRGSCIGEGHFVIAPSPPSYVPMMSTELSDKMSFFERLLNLITSGFIKHYIAHSVTPIYADMIKKYLGPDINFSSLFQAADIWLMRVDFVLEFPRPTMPNVIYMGGFQCKPAKPLPQHLEDFVQSSGEHGVIIMSLGTLIGELPHDLADEIAAAFAKLPQKVIWRHKGERPATLGNNTLLVDWMPQNDLLGHPKMKLFVAHGGINGVQEAIYHGVPVVGLPVFFDQYDNLLRLRERGAAKMLTMTSVDKDDNLLKAIQEVLNEPSYKMNMQRLSRLHRDQPMKPLDTALFWIEYVMRHKGAAHLRTESYKLPWYSYHSVDVVLFLAGVVLLVLLIIFILIRCFCMIMCKHKVKCD